MAIVLPILTTFNSAGINSASSALAGLGASLKKAGLAAAAAAVGVKALGASVNFLSESVNAARDLNRNLYALDTVFGDLSERMTTFTKNADTMGMSQNQAAKTATFLGSVLKQAGFSMEDTATQTEKLTMLAQDLATTYGYDTSEALTAMTALFRGEYDPIEKFGVALKQNEVNALLAAKGMGDLTGQALLNAQQQVRLEQLFKRSADAQGAYAAQSDTLFGVQTRLNASFENLQATVGQALVPTITEFTKSFIPLVNGLGPDATTAVQGIADVMKTLEPLLKPLAQIIGIVLDLVGRLLTALAPVINLIAAVAAVVLELAADLLTHLAAGLIAISDLFVKFADSLNLGDGAGMVMKFIGDFINGSKILKPLLGWIVTTFERINDIASGTTTEATDETSKLIRQRLERLGAIGGATTTPDPNTPGAKTKAKNYIKDFYDSLMDENRKRMASIRLQNAGVSAGLAESIVGSGEGWNKVYQSIISGGSAAVKKVQALFNTTKAGLKELEELAKTPLGELTKSLEEEAKKQSARGILGGMGLSGGAVEAIIGSGEDWNKVFSAIVAGGKAAASSFQALFNTTADGLSETKKIADELLRINKEYDDAVADANKTYTDAVTSAQKEYSDALADAIKKQQELADSFNKSMNNVLVSVRQLGQAKEDLGAFESEVVDAFKSINDQLADGLDSGAITKASYDALKKYAEQEMVVLRSIAKNRDELAKKKSLVEALFADVKSALVGSLNVTNLLSSQSSTVTETVTKLVNGITITTSRTLQAAQQGSAIVENFRKIVDGTKKFVSNLRVLRDAGLNSELFGQILQAGAEAGGATAQALVDGGPSTISEMNSLYKELGDVSAGLAEETAQKLYGDGLDLSNGILAGIASADQQFKDAGTALAKTFSDTFAQFTADATKTAMLAAIDAVKVALQAILDDAMAKAKEALRIALEAAAAAKASATAAITPPAPVVVPTLTPPPVDNTGDFVLVRPGAAGSLGFKGGTSLVDGGTTVNLTVNAGLGTNGAVLGGQIVDLIKKYEKTSGAVFA